MFLHIKALTSVISRPLLRAMWYFVPHSALSGLSASCEPGLLDSVNLCGVDT